MRRLRLTLIALAVIVFLAISALLARAFSIDGAERSAITALVTAEARGNVRQIANLITGCARRPSCRADAAQRATALRHPGKILIVELNSSAGFSLTSTLGTARVVWRAGSELPVVQCVRVRRAGDVISGLSIQLLAISPRIKTSSACPGAGDFGI